MFIDYLALMLVNLGAGLALLALYLFANPDKAARRSWAAGFFAVGFLGLVTSLPMVVMWPLPGVFNIAYGEPGLYLSLAFLAAAITLVFEWEPYVPAIYGLFGGIYAIVVGIRMANLHLSSHPTVALTGFVLTGIGGILVLPAVHYRANRTLTIVTAVILGLAALLWLYVGYVAAWGHMQDFAKYLPASMLVKK